MEFLELDLQVSLLRFETVIEVGGQFHDLLIHLVHLSSQGVDLLGLDFVHLIVDLFETLGVKLVRLDYIFCDGLVRGCLTNQARNIEQFDDSLHQVFQVEKVRFELMADDTEFLV